MRVKSIPRRREKAASNAARGESPAGPPPPFPFPELCESQRWWWGQKTSKTEGGKPSTMGGTAIENWDRNENNDRVENYRIENK